MVAAWKMNKIDIWVAFGDWMERILLAKQKTLNGMIEDLADFLMSPNITAVATLRHRFFNLCTTCISFLNDI